jgi:6-phosphogluconolactonase/glucosamine-6-phosphate isomerase/deaminase
MRIMPSMEQQRQKTRGNVAEEILQASSDSATMGRPFVIAVSPSVLTPAVVALLAADGRLGAHTHVFLADTQFEACDDCPASIRALLETLPLPRAQLHLDVADSSDPMRAAAAYEQELRAFFGLAVGDLPRFDAIVLRLQPCGALSGLNAAGHAISETSRLVISERAASGGARFVTLTPPVIQRAGRVFVTGCAESVRQRPSYGMPGRLMGAPNVTLLVQPGN